MKTSQIGSSYDDEFMHNKTWQGENTILKN